MILKEIDTGKLCKCGCGGKIISKLYSSRTQICIPEYLPHHYNHTKERAQRIRENNLRLGNRPPIGSFKGHKHSEETKEKSSRRCKEKCATPEMRQIMRLKRLGKKMPEEAKQRISKAVVQRILRNGISKSTQYYFVEQLGHKVHNRWEEQIGTFLKNKNIEYVYEKPFSIKYADNTEHYYYPDFTPLEHNSIIECKGRVREYGKMKLELFKKQYPHIKVIVVGNKTALEKQLIKNIHYDKVVEIASVL